MANNDARFGFRPVRSTWGGMHTGSVVPMYVNAAYESSGVFVGDVIVKVAAGSNAAQVSAPGAGTWDIGTLASVERATLADTNYMSGVVVAIAPLSAQLDKNYIPDLTEGIVYVETNPFTEYEVQAEGTATTTMIGANALAIETHAGSTVTGLSGLEIDVGTGTAPSANASYMFRIVRMVNAPDNDVDAANNRLIVVANMHSDLSTGDGDGQLGI